MQAILIGKQDDVGRGLIMRFWVRAVMVALPCFMFGVWLLNHEVPLLGAILLSLLAGVAVELTVAKKPRLPRPWDPVE